MEHVVMIITTVHHNFFTVMVKIYIATIIQFAQNTLNRHRINAHNNILENRWSCYVQ